MGRNTLNPKKPKPGKVYDFRDTTLNPKPLIVIIKDDDGHYPAQVILGVIKWRAAYGHDVSYVMPRGWGVFSGCRFEILYSGL